MRFLRPQNIRLDKIGWQILTISCMRQMVHAQVHPHHQILLFQRFAVEEFVEINHGGLDILPVICMARPWFRIFLFCNCKIMFEWMSSVFQITRTLDSQMTSSIARQDSIAAVFAIFVRLVRVDDTVLMRGSMTLVLQLDFATRLIIFRIPVLHHSYRR